MGFLIALLRNIMLITLPHLPSELLPIEVIWGTGGGGAGGGGGHCIGLLGGGGGGTAAGVGDCKMVWVSGVGGGGLSDMASDQHRPFCILHHNVVPGPLRFSVDDE